MELTTPKGQTVEVSERMARLMTTAAGRLLGIIGRRGVHHDGLLALGLLIARGDVVRAWALVEHAKTALGLASYASRRGNLLWIPAEEMPEPSPVHLDALEAGAAEKPIRLTSSRQMRAAHLLVTSQPDRWQIIQVLVDRQQGYRGCIGTVEEGLSGVSREILTSRIHDYLREHPGSTTTAVIRGVTGRTDDVSRALKILVQQSRVAVVRQERAKLHSWVEEEGAQHAPEVYDQTVTQHPNHTPNGGVVGGW